MKFILYVVSFSTVALFVVLVTAGNKEERKKLLKSMAEDCITESKASDKDVEDMFDKKLPTTKEGKCLAECMMRQFNCMNEKGEFQQKEFMDMCEMAIADNKTLETIRTISEECKDEKGPDNCETAALILSCMDKKGKEHGLDNMSGEL